MIRSAVLIQYTRVTDGRTDGIGVAYTRYSIYACAVARNKITRVCHVCVCLSTGQTYVTDAGDFYRATLCAARYLL